MDGSKQSLAASSVNRVNDDAWTHYLLHLLHQAAAGWKTHKTGHSLSETARHLLGIRLKIHVALVAFRNSTMVPVASSVSEIQIMTS